MHLHVLISNNGEGDIYQFSNSSEIGAMEKINPWFPPKFLMACQYMNPTHIHTFHGDIDWAKINHNRSFKWNCTIKSLHDYGHNPWIPWKYFSLKPKKFQAVHILLVGIVHKY